MCHVTVTVTVTVTIIKVIDIVKIIWITLMDLIEFNIKIMQKIKNTGKNVTKKIFHLSQILIETLNQSLLRPQLRLIETLN